MQNPIGALKQPQAPGGAPAGEVKDGFPEPPEATLDDTPQSGGEMKEGFEEAPMPRIGDEDIPAASLPPTKQAVFNLPRQIALPVSRKAHPKQRKRKAKKRKPS